MNPEKEIARLQELYPGKNVISIPPEDPSEIICETDPTSEHPDWSGAVAVIGRSDPHVHRKSTEIFKVLEGEVVLHVGDQETIVNEGEVYPIKPGEVHWAQANEAWVRVVSIPGWTPEDHILVDE